MNVMSRLTKRWKHTRLELLTIPLLRHEWLLDLLPIFIQRANATRRFADGNIKGGWGWVGEEGGEGRDSGGIKEDRKESGVMGSGRGCSGHAFDRGT